MENVLAYVARAIRICLPIYITYYTAHFFRKLRAHGLYFGHLMTAFTYFHGVRLPTSESLIHPIPICSTSVSKMHLREQEGA